MTDTEIVESLLNDTPKRITKVGEPTLSDLVGERRDQEAVIATGNRADSRLPYKTYDDIADADIYDPFDFTTVGNKVRSNVVTALSERFPIKAGAYTLALENLKYENPKNITLREEKQVLQSERSLTDRLRGDWVLYDNATGKELQRVSKTILNVPRMTERGTFIRNGSEYGLKHMFRLRPGLYARMKQDGTPSVHINPAQTTGRQMSINMDQASGIMTIKRETRTYGVLPMLKAAGVSDDVIKAAWGEDVFNMNKNKYSRLIDNPTGKQFKEYQDLWVNGFLPIKLDPETTLSTTGKPYETMTADALLTASNKVLKLSRSGSVDDEDDRDSLQYQRIMGPADYIPERIVRDGGGLIRKMVQGVMRSGNLNQIEAGALQPHVDSVFLEDRHAGYIDGASPFEALDLASNVSRIGEGGIGDTKAAPAETRGVNDSYLGFIDPVRSVECYSRKHELYTDKGWLNITEITEDCKLACLIDGSVEYHRPTAIHKYAYIDRLYSHVDENIAYEVTGNHRMLLLDGPHNTYQAVSDNMVDTEAALMDSKCGPNHNNNYVAVHVDDNPSNQVYTIQLRTDTDGDGSYHKLIDCDGEVFCVTVPGGRVFTRIPGYRGFWCGNSLKVGLEVYMSYGVKKDSKGNLYANFIDRTGKKALRPMGLVSSSYVATPEYYNPEADPEEFIPAFAKGKGIEYVQRKDVDFYLASSNNMMSIGAGMIPAIGGIRSNRTLMGCLAPNTEVLIIRNGEHIVMTAEKLLIDFKEGDEVYSLADDNETIIKRPIRQVVKSMSTDFWLLETEEYKDIEVTGDHKWLDHLVDPQPYLVKTKDLNDEVCMFIPYWNGNLNAFSVEIEGTAVGLTSFIRVRPSVYVAKYPYSVDIDVDDNVYMLANGIFTHNSKYPLQALPLAKREAPLVQRGITLDDGTESTTEKYVSKQLGAKYAPVSGKVVDINDDEITIRGLDGLKYTVSLYNDHPANQKGFISNKAVVKVGDSVSEHQCIAASNYTDDSGTAALGTNLKVAFMTGRGAGAFEDATYISESCARKLSSEQLYKFRGDMSSEVGYGKTKFINLFGQQDYTAEQLAKIDDNGFPEVGTVFHKGDPVFLGYQIRDLSTSGLSRTASVPYVKLWEHETPGTVIDVVKGRKHMTVYTKTFAPAVPGDKLCFDEKTEIMTKRGWIFIKDILQDDQVLTLDVDTGRNYFTEYSAAFRYECDKELLYHITTKRLDIMVTKDHKHPVAAMNNARYIAFQSSEQIFGKQRYFITGCNLQSPSAYACSRDDKAKERWEKYTGSVYCIMVPDTHTVYVRRNGKTVWSGNSGRYGNKAEISMIVPDDKMPRSADGTPFDIIASPLSLPSRLNTSMLAEAQLSKIAKATGKTYVLPDFMEESLPDFVANELNKHGMKSTEDVYDPETGKTIPGVESGYMFYYKLKHTAEYKERGRGTGSYSAEDVPLKGEGAARRLGMMETSAVYSGGGMDVLRDAKLIRGQRNDDFWRDYRDGKNPDIPKTPLVHKKFFAHLVGSGAKITQPDFGVFKLSTATDNDLKELTGNRKVERAATFNSKNMQPIDGGLFDPQIFGADGDRWGYYELPEPVLNPLMFKPIAGILGWSDTELREYLQGKRRLDDRFGPDALIDKLNSIDLKKELKLATDVLKSSATTIQQRDMARKRIRAISPMIKQGTKPSDYFFTRIPILPPRYRTVTTINGGETNIAADANFLYKRMIDSASDLADAKAKLPGEYQVDARDSLYNSINALVGLAPTDDPKLEAKGVSGLLKWAFGKGSPKCHDSETEILTENGWIPFPDYNDKGIAVGTMNPVTGKFEWQNPVDIIHEPYVGPMVYTHTSRLDCCVTPNHEHWVSMRRGRGKNSRWDDWCKAPASDLLKYIRRQRIRTSTDGFDGTIPNCANIWGTDTEAFAEFVGWYLADGWVHQDLCSVCIDVRADGVKDQKLTALLEKVACEGVRVRRAVYERPPQDKVLCKQKESSYISRFTVVSKDLAVWMLDNAGKGALTKKLSREVLNWDSNHLRRLWTGYHAGDGYKHATKKQQNGKTWLNRDPISNVGHQISTVSKYLVDDFEEIGAKIGCQINRGGYIQTSARHTNPVYTITLHGFNYSVLEYPELNEEVQYDGIVHCVEVPNGLIVTRRNHKVLVSGNSGSLHRKIFGSNLDLGGLGVIIPDSRLTIDQVGIPEESAWKMFEPFVVRELKGRGFSTLQAMKQVLERSPEAKQELINVMKDRPILLNRAPTLWRYGIQGQMPVLVEGNAIRINPNICGVYGADFDGDSVRNSVNIAISPKILNMELDKSQNGDILCDVTPKREDLSMLRKESKVELVNVRCAICDIPKIEGSEVVLNEKVTEWDVPEGVFAEAVDKETGKKVLAPVTKLSLHKDVDMYDIELATYGAYKHTITVSKDDTLLTYKDGDIVITDAEEALGRVVPRAVADDFGMSPEYCTKYIDLGKQYALSMELGIFLGMMIGDGWVDSQDGTWIAAENENIQNWLVESINRPDSYIDSNKNAHIYEYSTQRFGSDVAHRVWISLHRDTARVLAYKIGKGAYNKRIPIECMCGSKAHRLGVLIGLIATDGGVHYSEKAAKGKKSTQKSVLFHTTSQMLRDNIIDLCHSLGVKATATPYKGKNSLETCYAINLSVRDLGKLYNEDKRFRMIAEDDEVAMAAIAKEVFEDVKPDSYDIVPYPANISNLVTTYCKELFSASERNRYRNQGFISRDYAKRMVECLKNFDVAEYDGFNKGAIRSSLTAEEAKVVLDKWIAIVENTDVCWEVVTGFNHLGLMDGWDITVPGPLTFSLGGGTFVQDSMSTHVPVSNEAVRAIKENMMPSKNLLSPKNFKAHFVPKDAANEGLYLASRIGTGEPIRFRTEEEAQEAFRKGEIKIDTPIIIG